ncbi:site-specific integrase [Pseudolysinimonas sp.]|uniref:site-specific integrase n=1 Tax=Pseudolysinimonas sp. TaxID=2680009 RepID=UPI003F804625
MANLFRRCGCRREDGTYYGLLVERPTDAQRAAACPQLLSNPKHGSWGFAVSGGRHPGTGKRLQARKSGFPTRAVAIEERDKARADMRAGRYPGDRKLTVAAYLQQWIERRVEDGMRASTAFMYRRYIDQDIVPALGALPLTELRKHNVDAFVQDLRKTRGATTVRRIHATLSSALTFAVKLDLIESNPARNISLPSTGKGKIRIWDVAQVAKFMDATTHERLGAFYELAVFTGMRRGELIGLSWEDVDLESGEIIVRKQHVQVGKQVVEGSIKTDAGQDRRVSLGPQAIGALMAWRIRQESEKEAAGDAWVDTGRVFTREDGTAVLPHSMTQAFNRIVTRAGLPAARLHDLRHVAASLMLAGGTALVVVSKRLGHSNIAVTSDLYSHLLTDANKAAADAAEALLPTRYAHNVSTDSEKPEPLEVSL